MPMPSNLTESEAIAGTGGKFGKARRTVLFTAISIGIALAGLECLMRITGLRPPTVPYDNNLGDAELGMRPEAAKRWKADFPEYSGPLYMQTNNLGFYEDHDTAVQKTPGQVRIAVMGDSQTVGTCTPKENFPNVFENLLNRRAGREQFEVVNAAVGRHSPYQYYKHAEKMYCHSNRTMLWWLSIRETTTWI
jgi:hypothetical protein